MKRSKFQREALALLREQNATLRRIAAVAEQNSKVRLRRPDCPPAPITATGAIDGPTKDMAMKALEDATRLAVRDSRLNEIFGRGHDGQPIPHDPWRLAKELRRSPLDAVLIGNAHRFDPPWAQWGDR